MIGTTRPTEPAIRVAAYQPRTTVAKIGAGATRTDTTSTSARTSVASMTKNVNAIALNMKIESGKPPPQ